MRGIALLKKNHFKKALIATLVLFIPLLSYAAYSIAAETPTSESGDQFFTESDYSVETSEVELRAAITTADIDICNGDPNVTCRNLTGNNARLVYECKGLGSGPGGWAEELVQGQCWSNLDVIFFEGTINEDIKNPSGELDETGMSVVTPNSTCNNLNYSDPANKETCIHNYEDPEEPKVKTDDHMFALPKKASSFMEYQKLAETDPLRLVHITRGTDSNDIHPERSLMVPSGPPGNFSDYRGFMSSPPSFVDVKLGCTPASFSICDDYVIPPAVIDGKCLDPSLDETHVASQPAQSTDIYNQINLCSKGIFFDLGDDSTYFRWRCDGINGGNNSEVCLAKKPVPGICGSADGQYFSSQPSGSSLCQRGSVMEISGNGPWLWQCDSLPSGALNPVNCQADRSLKGRCGSADGSSVARAPGGPSLCSEGNATSVSGNGPWSWRCEGTNTAASSDDATCSAGLNVCEPGPTGNPENGTCGSANGGEFLTASAVAAAQRCLTGNPSTVTAAANSFSWTCNGTGSGATNQNCAAGKTPTPTCQPPATGSDENGTCGAAHGGAYSDALAVNAAGRCLTGSPGVVAENGAGFSWRCTGVGSGASDSCTASKNASYNAECRAYASTYTSQPATNDSTGCVMGTYYDVTDTSSEFKWQCVDGTAIAQCSATVQAATGSWRLDFTSVEDFGSCRDRLSGNQWCAGNRAPTGSCNLGSSCIHQSSCREPDQNSMTAYKTWDHYVCE